MIEDKKEQEYLVDIESKKVDIEEKRWRSCCFDLHQTMAKLLFRFTSRSCCFDLHQESSLFFAKLTISICVIGLCGYQLITLQDCQYQSLYSSLLSSVITFWLSKK